MEVKTCIYILKTTEKNEECHSMLEHFQIGKKLYKNLWTATSFVKT